MTAVTTTTAKSYFNRGDKPTESQFSDVIDMIGERTAFFANTSAMTAETTARISDLGTFVVAARVTANDGGGGLFEWDGTATTSANGGTIFAIGSAATGRILRRFSGAINAKWFGATGDDSTDDAAALQATIDFAATFGNNSVFVPAGNYQIGTALTVPIDMRIEGEGRNATIFKTTVNTINGFTIDAAARRTLLKNFSITSVGGIGASNAGIKYTETGSADNIVRNVAINSFFDGINAGNGLFNSHFDTVRANTCGTSFKLNSAAGSLISCLFTNCYSNQPTTLGYDLEGCKTITFDTCNSGSAGAPHANIKTVSVGITFIGCNFEMDSGSFPANSGGVIVQSASVVTLINPTFVTSVGAAADAFEVETKGTSQTYIIHPQIVSQGANMKDIETEGDSFVSLFDSSSQMTDFNQTSSVNIVRVYNNVSKGVVNSGTASVNSGDNVNHGMTPQPTSVFIRENLDGTSTTTYTRVFYAEDITSTAFKVRVFDTTDGSQVVVGGPWNIVWEARYV